MTEAGLQRAELLYGVDGLERLGAARVIVFGVGGVGSWCAEALIRAGVGHLTLVDADDVDVSNINRQLPATTETIGRSKAEVLACRFRQIRPEAEVVALKKYYTAENADEFGLEKYDIVIDAIDTVASKADLILRVSALRDTTLFSSMGAARRIDPGCVRDTEFWRVTGCPLARALRDRYKRMGVKPHRKIRCVYSTEALRGEPKGTSMPVTATFGLRLAALAINKITNI